MLKLWWSVPGFALVIALASIPPAAAQDTFAGARDLYASAAYGDALALLERLRSTDRPPEEAKAIDQYRAFCLLALGRADEAQRAMEAVVATDPLYRPDANLSPRVRQAFTDVRRRMLPAAVQDRYQQARASFDRKDYKAAAQGFKLVLAVLADPDMGPAASQPPMSDLRLLAAGFHDLSEKAAVPAPLTAVPLQTAPAAPVPVQVTAPPLSMPPLRIYSASDANVTPPVTVQQALPPYPGQLVPPRTGVLEIVINEAGAVESAAMTTPVSSAYDALALSAAKTWHYKPATLNGIPVKYRKSIQIVLKPAR